MPLGGMTLIPGAEADQEVGPVMAEPVLVMVNSTCPLPALQAPLTVTLDLSQTGLDVAVGVKVATGVLVGVLVAGGVLVGVLVGCLEQEPTVLNVTEDRNDVR